ncbi:MAG TPA: TonB-dependent receptor [Bryobacteraceae bacterium]|nr:TonB-dependent receptor [Bryobacteraceae bacterium]
MAHRKVRFALFLLASSLLRAQFSGRIAGTILDASGAPVPGATISLSEPGSTKALLSTRSTSDGSYHLIGIRPADYDLEAEAAGFAKVTLSNVTIDAARETNIRTITLQPAALAQSVEVSANETTVQTSNAEISDTVTMEEIQKLPLLDRDPLAVLQIQPGVVYQGNSATVINGMRTSFANMTLDGINIQDNYIRDNALDYTPNKLLVGQVRQMTMITSNANGAAPDGAAQVAFETPSGTNQFHGDAYWYNRNNAFAANDWFNNQAGVPISQLNQNQAGGSIAGPIKKDKLFFYTNYEGVRTDAQTPMTNVILTDTAREGIFTYRSSTGALIQKNLLALRGITIDPYIQKLMNMIPDGSAINNYTVGDSTAGNLMNTAGYRFNQRANEVRDNVTGRIDYNLSTRHVFSASYLWNRDNLDSPDPTFQAIPQTTNPNHSHFFSASWRWTPNGNLTNELRGGFNLAPGDFLNSQTYPNGYLITGMIFNDPVSEQMPQGRATNTYSISDNAALARGRHYIQFGFHMQKITVRAYNDAGIVPTYNLFMGTGQPALTTNLLPGISNDALANANALLATLGGYIDSASQTFNVTSRTSGYIPGAGAVRNFRFGNQDFYVQDNWKMFRTLTVTIGLRWVLPDVADEANSLELLPVIQNNNAIQTLLSNATLDFAGQSVGRPWYNRDMKNFAPNVGLAWDVFGDGKTAFRAGYSISYVNDQSILAPETMTETNAGLTGLSNLVGLSSRISTGLPVIPVPVYQVPLTVADNYALNPLNTVGLIDPNLRTPYVQQYSAGIQRQIKGTVVEARYVGNHGTGLYRAFDFNQINIVSNGFLGDFLKAENNGNLAFQKTGIFNPAYNAGIAGSQPLPVFAKLEDGGFLSDPTVRNLIQTGQAGQLAATYAENQENGSLNFFANPYALGSDMLTNFSNSTYNALQLTARHRAKEGLDVTANYSFSKVLSDTAGDSQSRIEQFLDVNNPKLERAPANFDLRHSIKSAVVYDLPFGEKHYLHSKRLDRFIGGWSLGTNLSWQSGAPFSILSGYGTLNRADGTRSYYNTADPIIPGQDLPQYVHFVMTGNGPYMISPSAINPSDGTGIGFAGAIFENPGAGTLGVLQRRSFYGPWAFGLNASLQKAIQITERQSLQLLIQAQNVLNHPTFWVGDQNINSTTFGAVASMLNSPRIMQFGLHYRF